MIKAQVIFHIYLHAQGHTHKAEWSRALCITNAISHKGLFLSYALSGSLTQPCRSSRAVKGIGKPIKKHLDHLRAPDNKYSQHYRPVWGRPDRMLRDQQYSIWMSKRIQYMGHICIDMADAVTFFRQQCTVIENHFPLGIMFLELNLIINLLIFTYFF